MRLLRALRAYIQTLFILIAQIDNLSYFFNRRQVLPHALEVLSEAGYSLVTVAECLGLDAYNSTSSYICSRFNEIPLISAPCSLVRIGVGSPGVPDVRSLSPIPFLKKLDLHTDVCLACYRAHGRVKRPITPYLHHDSPMDTK